MKNKTGIGALISARRKALGMTKRDLAAAVGYKSVQAITNIENGNVDLPEKKIAAFEKVLKMPLSTKRKKINYECDTSECVKGCFHWNTYFKNCDYFFNTGELRDCPQKKCAKFETYDEYKEKLKQGKYKPDLDYFSLRNKKAAAERQKEKRANNG